MKYWSYLVAKLAGAALLMAGVWRLMNVLIPEPALFLRYRISRFPQDLRWTTAIFLFSLACAGLLAVIAWDQRRRCRVCLSPLRMPVGRGSWSNGSLFAPPQTESICPFGHGTQKTPDIHLESSEKPAWREHENMWRELEQMDSRKD